MSELYDKLLAEKYARAIKPAKPKPASVPNITADTPLFELAALIYRDPAYAPAKWCAEPYRGAMGQLDDISDSYGADTGRSVVAYLVSNLGQYRGPRAKVIKAELRRRLKR